VRPLKVSEMSITVEYVTAKTDRRFVNAMRSIVDGCGPWNAESSRMSSG